MTGENRPYGPGDPMPLPGDVGFPRPDHRAVPPPRYMAEGEDRSLGDLFADLTRDMKSLVRQEVTLATTELKEKASLGVRHVAYIAAGGAVAYVGFIVLMFGIAHLLAGIMPLWLSMVLVGAIVAGVGYALISKGTTALKNTDFSLEKTTETLKEDKQWLKEEMK